MQLQIIAVGELKGWTKLAYESYAKRITKPYAIDMVELATPRRSKAMDPQQAKKIEAQKMAKYLKPDGYLITLDQHGKSMTTETFSQHLQGLTQYKQVQFVIGGPDGICPDLLAQSHLKLSLSAMVLPHALARVMLIEQIYRAYTMLTGHPYHRE